MAQFLQHLLKNHQPQKNHQHQSIDHKNHQSPLMMKKITSTEEKSPPMVKNITSDGKKITSIRCQLKKNHQQLKKSPHPNFYVQKKSPGRKKKSPVENKNHHHFRGGIPP